LWSILLGGNDKNLQKAEETMLRSLVLCISKIFDNTLLSLTYDKPKYQEKMYHEWKNTFSICKNG